MFLFLGQESNFRKNYLYEVDYQGTDYDYKSLMHYAKKSFIRAANLGNTVENKFDPNMNLGNEKLSKIDIIEINKLYQCDVKTGWGNWYGWSPCLKNWRDDCSTANVRICVSRDGNCPGANIYGTDSKVEDCPLSQCIGNTELNQS